MIVRITSKYGAIESVRNGRVHKGVDFGFDSGTPMKSVGDGTVEAIIDQGSIGLGKGVLVKLEDGTTAIYGHLSDIAVKKGEHISRGELLGHSGNTGHSTGPHLHFGLKKDGEFMDPSKYVNDIKNMDSLEPTPIQEEFNKSFKALVEEHADTISEVVNTIIWHF